MGVELWTVAGLVISLLLSGNIYFVKRLVEKVEKTGCGHAELNANVNNLSQSVAALGNQLREIKLDIKELRRIEIEVAVLRSQLNPSKADA